MTSILLDLGWRWVLISRGSAAHLVPRDVLVRSTSACGRPLHGRLLEEPVGLLYGAQLRKCALCVKREGTA